eukprot:9400563-Pyramimonas_sp.AAC.1
MELMEDYGLMALNTFGKRGRFNGTWRSPQGTWTRIDYVLVRRRGGYGHSSFPRADLPVNLGGYRDHRPLEPRVFAGAKAAKTVKGAGNFRWRRELMSADLLKVQQAEEDSDNSVRLPDRVLNFRLKVLEGREANGAAGRLGRHLRGGHALRVPIGVLQ